MPETVELLFNYNFIGSDKKALPMQTLRVFPLVPLCDFHEQKAHKINL